MNPAVFKAYDIRGLAPEEIHETFARRLGKVLAHLYHPKQVLVGRDMRASSLALQEALIEGLTVSGVSVVRIGLCSTPMFNFAMSEELGRYELGVMITASHNPVSFNGFKISHQNQPVGLGSGMEDIREMMLSDAALLDVVQAGNVEDDANVLDRYVERVVTLAQLPEVLPTWRIAIDAGNGMSGLVLPKICKRLAGIDVSQLYWDLDGTFPNHEANPFKGETLSALRKKVLHHQCAFGVAFDGDGDRVGFVDETGERIPGDLVAALLAREVLREYPGKKVIYDVRCSWSVPEMVRSAGGEAIMSKVGHASIKRLMAETGAVFGGELSMHFYFADWHNHEASEYAMLLLMKMMMREQRPLSQLWKEVQIYAHSGEINFPVEQPVQIMQHLEDTYGALPGATVSHLDGIRIELRDEDHLEQDWWFNVRISNTEPLLRLNVEARSVNEMEKHVQELSEAISANV